MQRERERMGSVWCMWLRRLDRQKAERAKGSGWLLRVEGSPCTLSRLATAGTDRQRQRQRQRRRFCGPPTTPTFNRWKHNIDLRNRETFLPSSPRASLLGSLDVLGFPHSVRHGPSQTGYPRTALSPVRCAYHSLCACCFCVLFPHVHEAFERWP